MTWFVVIVIAAGTFVIRASMLALSHRELSQRVSDRLGLVAPAALGALAISAIGHDIDLAVIASSVAGFAVVRRTGNVNHALIVGFPLLWLLSAIEL